MSDLIAVAYPDRATAETVRQQLTELMTQHVIELEDVVVVSRDEKGKVKLHQSMHPAAIRAAGGALWGGLIGLLFLVPLLGIAVGAAAGGAAGALTDVGVDDRFMKTLGRNLASGNAALILLVRKVTPEKLLPHVQQYGGEVIQTSLDDETEAQLRAALEPPELVAASAAKEVPAPAPFAAAASPHPRAGVGAAAATP
jgi:uncharacterized membrane protein